MSVTANPSPQRLRPRTLGGGIALAALFALAFAAGFVREYSGDFHWHVVLGDWTIANGIPYSRDVHSFTFDGRSMSTVSWLGDVVLSALFRAGGYPACFALRGLAISLWMVTLWRDAAPRGVGGAAIAAVGLVALAATWLGIYLRPELLGIACFAGCLWTLGRYERTQRTRALAPLVPLIVLWANVHGSLPVGLAAIGLCSVELALRAHLRGERGRALTMLALPLVALAASSVAPTGALTPFLFRMVDPSCASQAEWAPLRMSDLDEASAILLMGAFVTAALASKRASPWRTLLALALLVAALEHRRVLTQALVAASFLWVHSLTGAKETLQRLLDRGSARRAREVVTGTLTFIGLAFGLWALESGHFARQLGLGVEPGVYPEAACAFAQEQGLGGAVLNDFNYGSYLMFCLPEGAHVAIDQRVCSLYDGDFYEDYQRRKADQRELPGLWSELGADWAFVKSGPSGDAFAAHPDRFTLIYVDDLAELYLGRALADSRDDPSLDAISPRALLALADADPKTLDRAEHALDIQKQRCPECGVTRDAEAAVAFGRRDRPRFERARASGAGRSLIGELARRPTPGW